MSLLSGGVRTSLTDFLRVVYRPDDARMHLRAREVDTARPRPDYAGSRGAGAAPARVRADAALLHAQGFLSAARRGLLRAVARPGGVDLPGLIRAACGPLIRPIWPARPRPPASNLPPDFPSARPEAWSGCTAARGGTGSRRRSNRRAGCRPSTRTRCRSRARARARSAPDGR